MKEKDRRMIICWAETISQMTGIDSKMGKPRGTGVGQYRFGRKIHKFCFGHKFEMPTKYLRELAGESSELQSAKFKEKTSGRNLKVIGSQLHRWY